MKRVPLAVCLKLIIHAGEHLIGCVFVKNYTESPLGFAVVRCA